MYMTPKQTKALTQSPNSWDEPNKFLFKTAKFTKL